MKKLLIFMTLSSSMLWAANNNEFIPQSQWSLPTNFTLSESIKKSVSPNDITITFSKKSAPFNKNFLMQNQIKTSNNLKSTLESIKKEKDVNLESSTYTQTNQTKNNADDDKLVIISSVTINTKINNNALTNISDSLGKNNFTVESIKYSISNEELNKQKNLMTVESYKKFDNIAKEIMSTGNFKKYKISNFSSYENNNPILTSASDYEGANNPTNNQNKMFEQPTPITLTQETNVVIIFE